MIIRRYYPRGFKGKTYSDEYIALLEEKGVSVDLVDTAKYELILTPEEQHKAFEQCCDMVLNNTGWVLDNLDNLTEFKVGWENYKKTKF